MYKVGIKATVLANTPENHRVSNSVFKVTRIIELVSCWKYILMQDIFHRYAVYTVFKSDLVKFCQKTNYPVCHRWSLRFWLCRSRRIFNGGGVKFFRVRSRNVGPKKGLMVAAEVVYKGSVKSLHHHQFPSEQCSCNCTCRLTHYRKHERF